LAETSNGLYQAELIHQRTPWKTREALELATLEWVAWFNHVRLLESAGSSHPPKLGQTTTGNSPTRPNQQPALNPNGLHAIRSGSASLLSRMQE
jgi:transposase InsO family protein